MTTSPVRAPRTRGRLAVAAAALGGMLMVLAVAELWLLPAALGLSRERYLLGFTADAPRVDDVDINALGFTGDVPSAERRPGTIRVLTLGGSSLFNRRMTERLGAALREASPRPVEVLGAALRLHTSAASLRKYRALAHHGFDVVLVYHGINDLYANHVAPDDFRTDYGHLEAWYVDHFLLRTSVLARTLYNRLLYAPPRGVIAGSGFRSAETLRRHLAALVGAVRGDGGAPVLATFAWHIPEDYTLERFLAGELEYVNPERYDPQPVEQWGPPAWVREGLIRHNVVVHEVAQRSGARLLDVERRMGGVPAYFGDVCHFSEKGTDVFVRTVADYFVAEGLLSL